MGVSSLSCPICGTPQLPGAVICPECHTSLSAPVQEQWAAEASLLSGSAPNPSVPDTLIYERYRVVTVLRETSGGALYLAEDTELGNRRVVLKELRLAEGSPEDCREAVHAFRQEALLLSGLSHPSLPRIYEQFSEGGREYLVREYLEGQTLAEYKEHAPGGHLSVQAISGLGTRLAGVLDYLHTRQPPVVLGNLRPAHVLITPEGQVFILDVSLTRQVTSDLPKRVSTPGESRYAAPEQLQGVPRQESDQYALALILAEALTGRTAPSRLPSENGGDQPVTPSFFFSSSMPSPWPAIEGVLRQALSPNPQARYPTIQAFASALEQASRESAAPLSMRSSSAPWPGTSSAQPVPPLSRLPSTPHQPRAKLLLIAAIVIVLLAGTGTAAYGFLHLAEAAIRTSYVPPVPPTATLNLNLYYSTSIPGPGCDASGGIWRAEDVGTQVSCSASGMKLTQAANVPTIAEAFFFGPQSDYTFPQNYTIQVEASQLENRATCVGVETREQATGAGGYSFEVCGDGTWNIFQYVNATGAARLEASGDLTNTPSYIIQVTGQGTTQHFSVNGTILQDLSDTTYLDTVAVGLIVDTGSTAAGGSALFSNFIYTLKSLAP